MPARQVVAKHKGDTNVVHDFAAGIDPTGVATFKAAMRNKKNHLAHKTIGAAGGFVGGTALGIAIPAAVYGLGSLALKRRMPNLSQTFRTASKDTAKALNPVHLYKSLRATPASASYLSGLSKIPAISKRYRASGGNMHALQNVAGKHAKADKAVFDSVEKAEKGVQRWFPKGEAAGNAQAAITGLLGVAGGLGSGILNASSAWSQYNAALGQRGLDKNGRPIAAKRKM